MRKTTVIIPIAAALAAALSYASPAVAATTGGTLDITIPAGPVNLGSVTASASHQTITGAVDFTGPQTIRVSAAGGSSYTPGNVTATGTATVTGSTLSPLRST